MGTKRENSPLWSNAPIYVHTYTPKVQNHYKSSKYGHVWTQMKGLDELITILHTRTYGHAPMPRDTHFIDLSSRSNINENYLIHDHFIGRVPCDDSSAAVLHYALYMNNGHVT